VPLPATTATDDWASFEDALRMRALAHRFTVLLPVSLDDPAPDTTELEARRALARRIVELQKPVHTIADVRFYWSAFRIGEARLGEDSALDLGSRSPQLLRPAIVGRDHVGESYLGDEAPPHLTQPPSFGRRPELSDSHEETS
jgi:hypothetical protein